MSDLPSLSALRAFETAARLTSYSAAARELNVTHAAIAQHVRKLERIYQCSLMQRAGQTMQPTPEGLELADGLAAGFAAISQASQRLMERSAEQPLSLTTTASFAEHWLLPRLAGFWRDHPDIPLSLSTENDVADLRRGGFGLAIRYGHGTWPGVESRFLAPADTVIVGTPDLLAGLQTPVKDIRALQAFPWIYDPSYPDYMYWCESLGLQRKGLRIQGFPGSTLTLKAGRSGLGLVVCPRAVVSDDLERGDLQLAFRSTDDALAYYIVTLPDVISPARDTFVKWLVRQART